MIRLHGISFGFGVQLGTLVILRQPVLSKEGGPFTCFIDYDIGESATSLLSVANQSHVTSLLISNCSSYSHFGAGLWSLPVPTMALLEVDCLIDGAMILTDFDAGFALIAESDAEIDLLSRLAAKPPEPLSDVMKLSSDNRNTCPIMSILAEASSASELIGAETQGANGLSVVRAEQLTDANGYASDSAKSLIALVRNRLDLQPLLVRFFDDYREISAFDDCRRTPPAALGYRGVRMLEIDQSAQRAFLQLLDSLEFDSVCVILPMVTTVAEVVKMRSLIGPRWKDFGITVETPAAALRIQEFFHDIQFVQIGLNDLTQYTMAWSRDFSSNERLPADRIVEPVAELIAQVAEQCTLFSIPYTLGLDLRPTRQLARQIHELGVSSISCPPPLVGRWKIALGMDRN
jgi:phosphoenolpyruvate-protein kinase (PTS system EI component)